MGAFGVRGELRVQALTEDPARLLEFPEWRVGQDGASGVVMHLVSGRRHGAGLAVSLREVTSREMAQSLLHASVWVDRRSLPDLDEGWFYWSELIGCSMWTREQTYIGQVTNVFATGANDVLVVHDDTGSERLVPFTEEVVLDVDPVARRMTVQLLDGM
jgi:16S rRNA processing protein RimM